MCLLKLLTREKASSLHQTGELHQEGGERAVQPHRTGLRQKQHCSPSLPQHFPLFELTHLGWMRLDEIRMRRMKRVDMRLRGGRDGDTKAGGDYYVITM